jgi:acetylornithine deacetylase
VTSLPDSGLLGGIDADLRARREDLHGLLAALVAFDTTGRMGAEPARDEEPLQHYVAGRLRAIDADVGLWEPVVPRGQRCAPDGMDFAGRPQLAGRIGGAGRGRSLLMAGHIDCVSVEPRGQWTSDPYSLSLRDGRLYGRGVADMKGGVAAILFVLEAFHRLGVRLAGDVLMCTVTDEETTGAGSWAAADHGVAADAGIVPEPTGFNAWVACMGWVTATLTIPGRAGHAALRQPEWRSGGAVNAIEKLDLVLEAIRSLRRDWERRPDQQHPLLNPGNIVPTLVRGGHWDATYPAECSLSCKLTYLPQEGAEDAGAAVRREVEERVATAVAADPWLAEHPPRWSWGGEGLPAHVPPDLPLVGIALGAGAETGHPGHVAGLSSWHDAANFTHFGATPTFSYGPVSSTTSHKVDESVSADELLDYCRALARIVTRWCGVADA